MKQPIKVLVIVGSPHKRGSNTAAFAENVLDRVEEHGVRLSREVVILGAVDVRPCRGCWACTTGHACPLSGDDLAKIQSAMLECDMLVLASPVYTNQVTAQMKAFFDRLFTWCHVFPLLGKPSLSVVTTGNDGCGPTGRFLEKMLATYGTHSFGTVAARGAFTPGFFPRKESETARYAGLAKRVARTLAAGRTPPATAWNRRMFRVMKRKMAGTYAVHYLHRGPIAGQPDPPRLLVRMIEKILSKRGPEGAAQLEKLAGLMTFELGWWRDRNWLGVRSLRELERVPIPATFDPGRAVPARLRAGDSGAGSSTSRPLSESTSLQPVEEPS